MARSVRDLKRRIRSVVNMEQITKAMKMVAAAQVRTAEERAREARPYADAIREALSDLTARGGNLAHPFFEAREEKRILYIVISADRGLAGPYNTHVLRKAAQSLGAAPSVFAVGRKSREYFATRGVAIAGELLDLGDHPSIDTAQAIAEPAMQAYLEGEVDAVRLVWNRFTGTAQYQPTAAKLLPLGTGDASQDEAGDGGTGGTAAASAGTAASRHNGPGPEIDFEPDAESVLGALLPHYFRSVILGALLEAKAAEHGARMIAMDAASKNAGEMIDDLTLIANRLRQAAITKEISEIVGGVEALKA